jgi:diguanylate cyclase (GGDEF)-like protein/PAS domain S-box-containing protein
MRKYLTEGDGVFVEQGSGLMIPEDRRRRKRRADDVRWGEDLVKRYEFLLHHTRDNIFTVRYQDKNILDANTAAVNTYQYSLAEFRSMTMDDLQPAGLTPHLAPRPGAGSRVVVFETTHRRKNGETFPVEVSSQGVMMGGERVLLCMVGDLSEKKQSEEAHRRSENNLRALLNAVTESLLLVDKSGTVLAANEMFAKRLRRPIDGIIGANFYDLLPPDTARERRKQAEKVLSGGKPVRFVDIRNSRYIDQVIYPVCDDRGEVARLAFFGADITQRREMEKELEAMALSDQLTGLYNRRGFFTLAPRELKRAERSAKGLLLFFADVDGLKEINDRFGHEEGDRALSAAAKILTQTFRGSDVISRIGGDEFAVLVTDTDETLMEKMLLRLYRLINNFNGRKAARYKLAISIGHAFCNPRNPATLDELISQADQRMYRMKKIKYRQA